MSDIDAAVVQCLDDLRQHTRQESISLNIANTSRSVGASASYHVSGSFGPDGVPRAHFKDEELAINLLGTAGQSFGAFLTGGLRMALDGDGNDYVGKGLSGGTLVIKGYDQTSGVAVGNACLYGATGGRLFLRGMAAQRFAVRNSGAVAVLEGNLAHPHVNPAHRSDSILSGAGDHCCEYMTGGICVVLGKVGKNFAAGMTGMLSLILNTRDSLSHFKNDLGGLAYVWCPTTREDTFRKRCNLESVSIYRLSEIDPGDAEQVRSLLQDHVRFTGSSTASTILARWSDAKQEFLKVYPNDFRRVLEERMKAPSIDMKSRPSSYAALIVAHATANLTRLLCRNNVKRNQDVNDIEDLIAKYKDIVPKGQDAKVGGFMRYPRKKASLRRITERLVDFEELYPPHESENEVAAKKMQSARCMDCGTPFCQSETGAFHVACWNHWVDLT